MRIQTFVPLLLATSVYALPGKDQNAKRVETPTPTPTPTPEEPPATTTEEPPATTTADEEEPEPTEDLSTDEKCGLEFNAGDADIIRDTWKNSGADAFLSDFLDENGAENWVDELFRQTVGGGKQGGSTYNCVNFPAEGSCTSPGHELCTEYEPPEMFFVHLSIANLYSSYIRLHEEMQDSMIVNLASEIKKIVDIFGPPPPEDDSIFAILIGAFVGAAALAGPVWQIASVATGAVGGLNIAAGVASQSDEEEPIDFEHDLELSLGSFYSTFADILEDTVKAIFGGKFDDLEGFDSDPVDFIKDQFAEGKMLDHTLVDPAMDEWIDAAINLIVSTSQDNHCFTIQNLILTSIQETRTCRSVYEKGRALCLARREFQRVLSRSGPVLSSTVSGVHKLTYPSPIVYYGR